jgi:regulatory protein YycI of two-component signal transduction system YycFG
MVIFNKYLKMKRVVFVFIVLMISVNIFCEAQNTKPANVDKKLKVSSGEIENQVRLIDEDSLAVTNKNCTGKCLQDKERDFSKKEVHDFRKWRFEKFMLNMAQTLNDLLYTQHSNINN